MTEVWVSGSEKVAVANETGMWWETLIQDGGQPFVYVLARTKYESRFQAERICRLLNKPCGRKRKALAKTRRALAKKQEGPRG